MKKTVSILPLMFLLGCVTTAPGQNTQSNGNHDEKQTIDRIQELIGSAMLDQDAEVALRKHLEAAELAKGIGHAGLEAMAVAGAGALYESNSQYTEALEQFERAKTLLFETVGPEDPACIYILSAIGDIWGALEDHEKMISFKKQALAIAEASQPENKIQIADLLTDLAASSFQHSGCELAVPYCEKSAAIYENHAAPDNENMQRMRDCVAQCKDSQIDSAE